MKSMDIQYPIFSWGMWYYHYPYNVLSSHSPLAYNPSTEWLFHPNPGMQGPQKSDFNLNFSNYSPFQSSIKLILPSLKQVSEFSMFRLSSYQMISLLLQCYNYRKVQHELKGRRRFYGILYEHVYQIQLSNNDNGSYT